MKIILGQGNPGPDYAATRHNIGFMTLDALAKLHSAVFIPKTKFSADIAEITVSGEKVLLVKPTTFYNDTGISARKIVDFYKIENSDIAVVHDELALQLGTIRTRQKGSDAGNNGIKSLNSHIGPDYARIRIGVANDLAAKMNAADFVLAKFNREESALLSSDIIPKAIELVNEFAADTLPTTSFSFKIAGE